jgi:hypothetical protein
MSTTILRTLDAWWVRTPTGAVRIDTEAETAADLLGDRRAVAEATGEPVPVESLKVVSPLTTRCRVVA